MKKIILFLMFFSMHNFGFSQTKSEINNLLDGIILITKNSKNISKSPEAVKLINFGWQVLPTLSDFFTNQTPTNINSKCIGRLLNKGEIAIILADIIEGMPYAWVTGVQNCTLTFCDQNKNLIEYYLPFIKNNGVEKFQVNYQNWLKSDERIDWNPYLTNKSKKELLKIKKERELVIKNMQGK
ncbi:MAG: hypothetical protein MUF43_04580 [Flavobacterium sp.]|nr:hypothetical protein [Flavobacterium sp.]